MMSLDQRGARTPVQPADGAPRRLIVSVHDVAPAFADEVSQLLAALDRIGARPRVLKVVPCWGDGPSVWESPDLARLLRAEVDRGSEVVLHGYTHRTAGPVRGSPLSQLRARLFAGEAAEFLSLEEPEARRRLERGRALLRTGGLEPRGFCAPGWLARRDLFPTLRQLGFRYYVGLSTLYDLRDGRRWRMPWIGYMGAAPWHECLVQLGSALLLGAAAGAPVMKVFLHPQGFAGSRAAWRVLQTLAGLLRDRQPITYGDLLEP